MRIFIATLAALVSVSAFSKEIRMAPPSKAAPLSLPVTQAVAQKSLTFLNPAQGWSIDGKQKVEFDAKLWKKEALSDGSEIYNFVGKQGEKEDQKRVILREGENLSSISSFRLLKDKGKTEIHEESASVVFHKGDLYAVTQCRDENTKDGRNCLTVTRQICGFVTEPAKELPKSISDQLKVIEVRALATILTLRGPDHQLENLAKHGNRLGLKNPLQTTKGKLTAKDEKLVSKVREEARSICQSANLLPTDKVVAGTD